MGTDTQDGTIVIIVTRLSGAQFALNPDLLGRIECTPDTVLVMLDGGRYLVQESMEEVIEAITIYRASIVSRALASGEVLELSDVRAPVLLPVSADPEGAG